MLYTNNLNLKKPEQSEYYNVDDFNENADILDSELAKIVDKTIDGVKFNGDITHFGKCFTNADVAEKTVTCEGFNLVAGARIIVKFANTNTATSPKLNVNGTGAKPIYHKNAIVDANKLSAGCVLEMVYDGDQYLVIGEDKLYDSVGTATNGSLTQKAIKENYMAKTDIIPISQGGTGATTAEQACINLDAIGYRSNIGSIKSIAGSFWADEASGVNLDELPDGVSIHDWTLIQFGNKTGGDKTQILFDGKYIFYRSDDEDLGQELWSKDSWIRKQGIHDFTIPAGDKYLIGKDNETLTWCGQNVLTHDSDGGSGSHFYIRFSNGFQICYGVQSGITTGKITRITYAIPFAKKGSWVTAIRRSSVDNTDSEGNVVITSDSSTSYFEFVLSKGVNVGYIALGWWK